jgi:hypothetical protein
LTAYCVVAARSMPLVAADVSRLIPFPFAFICPRMAKVRADSRPLLQAAASPGNFPTSFPMRNVEIAGGVGISRPGSVEKTFRRLTAYCVVAALAARDQLI